jgi:hypothetical protein
LDFFFKHVIFLDVLKLMNEGVIIGSSILLCQLNL